MNLDSSNAVLREMLEIERECCHALADVLERERAAASAHDLGALLSSNKEREATQARWERIAVKRREWMRRTGATMADLARGDLVLEALRAELEASASEIGRAQRVNQGLVQAVLGQVSGLIDTIRRELPSSRYDSGAALTTPMPAGGVAGWSA